MTEGFVKIYRTLLDDALWQICSPEQKVIMITLLLKANYQTKEWGWNGNKFKVEPGELITSLESIKKDCGKKISLQNIRSALAKFKKYGFLTEEVTKVNRKISILNWEKYQTTNMETNKEVTKRSQRGNKEVTTNKKDKKEKKEKNKDISTLARTPKVQAAKAPEIFFNREEERFEGITKKDIELWHDAYPAVDLQTETARAIAWILANKQKGHKSNWRKFLTNWYSRTQDRGGT